MVVPARRPGPGPAILYVHGLGCSSPGIFSGRFIDVACAHGNTVGALDDEALFYARSRGIPEADARAMLIGAFLAEVADRIEHIQARELAHEWLERQLKGRAK